MALREGTRRWAIRGLWAGLLLATALLVGLRIGRPIYYTDGAQPFDARSLAASGMVRWGTPDAVAELPGPVVGRVAELPDGRLVYGRATADGTTDLVVFDPARPSVPPEPAYGCNTEHNELAPAVGEGGRLWFASDRPGSAGGYDLYETQATGAGFTTPVPLTAVNTARDETDPAPHGNGVDFVFVRIDRQQDGGRGGQLLRWRRGDPRDPEPVFAPGPRPAPTDRDPVFAPSGAALWFVRRTGGERLQLHRASMLEGRFDAPLVLGATWGTGELRSPQPRRDGLTLGLLRPGDGDGGTALWYRSTATELVPWWPGQRWLEWLLLGAAGFCALLLLLLHLGRRWSSLDFVAQCLLLSLLLHILLFLWLWGVEIPGASVPGDDADGAIEVSVVASSPTDAASAAAGPQGEDIAARVQFAMAERALAAASPDSALEPRVAAAALDAPAAAREAEATAREVEANAAVVDAAAPLPARAGTDATSALTATELAAPSLAESAAAAAADGSLAAANATPVTAASPAPAVDRPRLVPDLVAGEGVRAPAPVAADPEVAGDVVASLQDAGATAELLQQRRDGAGAAPVPVDAAATTVQPTAAAGPTAARPTAAAGEPTTAAAPGASVPRPMAMVHEGPQATASRNDAAPTPQPRAVAATLREGHPAEAGVRRSGDAPKPTPVTPVVRGDVAQAAANAPAVARGEAPAGKTAPVPDLVVPPVELQPGGGRVQPEPSARPTASVQSARSPAAPAAVVRDAASAASPARDAVAGAAGGSAPRPLGQASTKVEPVAAAGPAAQRSAAVGTTPTDVRAPSAALDRSLGRTSAPLATSPAVAPRTATKSPPIPVALREGASPAVPTGQAATSAAAAPAVVAALAPVMAGPVPTDEATKVARGATPGSRPEPPLATPPPGSALARASAAAFVPAMTPTSTATARATNAPRVAALRDGAPAGAPLPTATAVRPRTMPATAPFLPPTVQPLAAAIEPPRRERHHVPAPIPIPRAVAPGSLLERAVPARMEVRSGDVGTASAYSNRFGPAKAKAIEQFGGTKDTERAVANGLRYLASIQSADGTWGDRDQYDGKYGSVYVGKTALCVLAFLGAGHTPTSRTEHSAVVARAIDHLLSLQDEDTGAFGPSSCYGHGITTYALAECYGITKAERLQRPVEAALTWILENQGPRRDRRNRGGWGYFSPGLQPEDDYARVSVSAWMIMALESARLSGVELPTEVLPRAREYLELSFDQKNGWFRYNHKPSRLQSAWPTLPASTPAGAFCLMLLGAGTDDPKVTAAVEYTAERRPEAYRRYDDDEFVLRGQGNVYFWYYGTLCCFLAGGESWERWNERLRTVLPAAQAPDGSFPPIDTYAREAGDTRKDRSYTTAMCVLSLEIYYRYFTPLLVGR